MKIILSGGGTGGHIYPAISIAKALQKKYPQAEFLFVGAQGRMEMEKVPQEGFDIEGLPITGIERKIFSFQNILFPFRLIRSLWMASKILKEEQPDVVIGTGGYASAAVLKMATVMRIPTLIQEQNSYPGITNRWLSKKVDKICVAYRGLSKYFPKEKIKLTGNPVRTSLLDIHSKRDKAIKHFNLNPNRITVLVIGGSLGAKAINEFIAYSSEYITTELKKPMQILWQCGKYYYEEYEEFSQEDNIQVHAFISQMDLAYAAADIIISRAGASSVSELCLVAKPVIFIPSPNVAEDHQTKNAQAIVDQGAGILINQKNLNDKNFDKAIEQLQSSDYRKVLSLAIHKLARPEATSEIVEQIEELITEK